MNKTIALFLFVVLSCSFDRVEQDDCTETDFYGTMTWRLTSDSLLLKSDGDFVGKFAGWIEATADSNVLTGMITGKFKAPLGEDSFVAEGSMIMRGRLIVAEDHDEVTLHVLSGDGDFVGVVGYIDLYWNESWAEDKSTIYYTGSFCFPKK